MKFTNIVICVVLGLALAASANGKIVVSLFSNSSSDSDYSYALIDSELGNVTLEADLPDLDGFEVISTQHHSRDGIFDASVHNDSVWAMFYIFSSGASTKFIQTYGPILGHDFHIVQNKSVVLLGGVNSSHAAFYEVDLETEELTLLYNITAPKDTYFSLGAPLTLDDEFGRIFVGAWSGEQFVVLGYALKTGLYIKTIASNLYTGCHNIGARAQNLYCLDSDQLLVTDLKSGITNKIATSWCDNKGSSSVSQNSCFDWGENKAYSFFDKCGEGAALFQIDLDNGTSVEVSNQDLNGVFGPHVMFDRD